MIYRLRGTPAPRVGVTCMKACHNNKKIEVESLQFGSHWMRCVAALCGTARQRTTRH